MTLLLADKGYSQVQKEALVIIFAVKYLTNLFMESAAHTSNWTSTTIVNLQFTKGNSNSYSK